MVYITAIRLSASGNDHEHITHVRWRDPADQGTGESTREVMADWIQNKNGEARVRDAAGHEVRVGVVTASPPYLRTHADGNWNNNLLALPQF